MHISRSAHQKSMSPLESQRLTSDEGSKVRYVAIPRGHRTPRTSTAHRHARRTRRRGYMHAPHDIPPSCVRLPMDPGIVRGAPGQWSTTIGFGAGTGVGTGTGNDSTVLALQTSDPSPESAICICAGSRWAGRRRRAARTLRTDGVAVTRC